MESWNIVSALEGLGDASGEGSHFAAAYLDLAMATLDFFFGMLLTSLNTFRPFTEVDPSGALNEKPAVMKYLLSHTEETDPAKR